MSDNISINKPINSLNTNIPLDIRTLVNSYSDISLIPNPYIGMTITVKIDETNDNKMTDYKVKSLKSNELGMNNTVIDEIERLDVYIGIDEVNAEINSIKDFNNSIVGVASDFAAISVRNSIPSGFVKLGELDYDYMENVENKIKLKSVSIAYINGYSIDIPANTIVDIGRAPEKETREDLIFLEAWKDEEFPITGKLSWRIRHVAGVDFETYNMDGFSAGTNGRNRQVTARGTNADAYIPAYSVDDSGSFNRGDLLGFNDCGLFVTSYNKELFKTLDGYVYAIPMFRLYRKPSCGKAIPFEYSKFNPKCDYSKFSKLMREDKVERVINENIKGRSLVNLLNPISQYGRPTYVTNDGDKFRLTKSADNNWYIWSISDQTNLLIPGKTYTFIINITAISSDANGIICRLHDKASENNYITLRDTDNYDTQPKIGRSKTPITIPSDWSSCGDLHLISLRDTSPSGSFIEISEVSILEGDYTNKEIPEFFIGLKSLGEDDNNLITIKNEILDKDTYDPETNTSQKLTAFDNYHYISCDSKLQPSLLEANIKSGETETPITSVNCKIDTTPNDEIEVVKICGNTRQNLITELSYSTIPYHPICKSTLLKPNTTYTLFVNNTSNTTYNAYINEYSFEEKECYVVKGINKIEVKTLADIENTGNVLKNHPGNTSFTLDNIMLLEGSYTDANEQYVEGLQSVDNINMSIIGKNLISKDMYTNYWFTSQNNEYDIDRFDNTGKKYSIYGIKTFGLTSLKLSCNKYFDRMLYRGKDKNSNVIWCGNDTEGLGLINEYIFNIPSDVVTMDLYVSSTGIDDSFDFMLKEIDDDTTYQSYKNDRVNININEPLMSLPNGVCDELVGNKITRKVGKEVISGLSRLILLPDKENDTSVLVSYEGLMNLAKLNVETENNLISDRFPFSIIFENTNNHEGFYISNSSRLYFRIHKTKLSSIDNAGITRYFSEKSTTVYYELANPVEEYLYRIYDKESAITYQLNEPLRSLPNGIKDEIKDNILTRRCGERIFDGSEDEGWVMETEPTTVLSSMTRFYTNDSSLNMAINTHIILNDRYNTEASYSVETEGVYSDTVIANRFWIQVLKSKLESQNVESLKNYLKTHPIKIIYELGYPVEIPLIESGAELADYSLNRQFKEGNYLRELPNGTKDTIENGKVIRRTMKVIYDGSSDEQWTTETDQEYTNCIRFNIHISNIKPGSKSNVLSNRFEYNYMHNSLTNQAARDKEGVTQHSKDNVLSITILKSRLSTLDIAGFRLWLSQNPVSVIYELSTPVEETLSNDNTMYFPYHDINTYYGNMYISDGRNHIVNDNKVPTGDSIILDTSFRQIENVVNIEDCKYKKTEYGYNTSYTTSSSSNLLDISNDNIIYASTSIILDYIENGFSLSTMEPTQYANVQFLIFLKKNVGYTISYNSIGAFAISDLKTMSDNKWVLNLYNGTTFTVNESGYYRAAFYCTQKDTTTGQATFTNVKITESSDIDNAYVPYKKTIKYLENIEENDIVDLRHLVSLTGFSYPEILQNSFDKLLKGEL